MKKRIYRLISFITAVIVIASCSIFVSAETEEGLKTGDFPYYSRITNTTEKYGYEYDDAWFTGSSSGYDVDRARLSMRMALAAGRTTAVSVKGFFDALGISYEDAYVKFPTPKYDYEGKTTTIGYAIGSKKIEDEDGRDCDLVVVAVRSAGYKAEWGSNFKIGQGEEHAGFKAAADKVLKEVSSYMDTLDSDNAKVWITGFSRGGAVGNICAHQLNEWADSGKYSCLDSRDDIFAYCFECPRLVKGAKAEEDNIINVVNSVDLVTKIAPQKWGYERYGVDYYIPSAAYVADFDPWMDKQVDEYVAIAKRTSAARIYSEDVLAENVRGLSTPAEDQVSFTRVVADTWADCFESQEKYCSDDEKIMAELAASWQGSAENTAALIGAIPGLKDNYPKVYEKLLAEGTDIYQAHLPEYTLSWVDSIDSASDFVDPKFRKLMVEGSADISIKDGAGNEASVETYTDENGEKIAVLPCDGEYEAEITAAEDGELTIKTQEWDDAAGKGERVVEYDSIKASEGDTLTLSIEKISSGEHADYALKDEEGKNVRPTRDYTGDGDREFILEAVSGGDGEGEVTGSGTYLNGEYVSLKARSAYDSFEGWYMDGEKISEDREYWFRVTADTTVTGSFKAHEHKTGDRKIEKATLKEDGKVLSVPCTICGKEMPETVIPKVASVKLKEDRYTYDGKIKKPAVEVKDAKGKILKSGTDYAASYAKGRKSVGKYKVTVEGRGDYSFTKTLYFKIIPKGTVIASLSKGKKSFTVKWKKQSSKMAASRIAGYQVRYSPKKDFTSGIKVKTKRGYSKTQIKVSKLKAGKTYYVEVRTYKIVKGQKYFSRWSEKKAVKTG